MYIFISKSNFTNGPAAARRSLALCCLLLDLLSPSSPFSMPLAVLDTPNLNHEDPVDLVDSTAW